MKEPVKEQLDAIDFMVDAIINQKKVVGFIAPGGCGKTFTMKHLVQDKRISEFELKTTATTNKAVTVMKQEGLPKSTTLHKAISRTVPTKMFKELELIYDTFNKKKYKLEPTLIVSDFLKELNLDTSVIFSNQYRDASKLIAENGVNAFDDRVFSHFAIGEYIGGVISIDESSQLPTKSFYKDGKMKAIGLDIIQKIFDTVILVGDDSQLPPINGESSFDDIDKVTLTENHRSDKGLLRLLQYARDGKNLSFFEPKKGESVVVSASVGSEYYDRESLIKQKAVHIVYRNATRKHITKTVRHDLSSEPTENEPIVYKGATIDEDNNTITKNETGFFNGVLGEWENHKQSVSGRNFDEYGDGFTYLQYGYAITAHTAQGSSFDYVIVHLDDIPTFIPKETKRKWIYTAVSRARKGVIIVF